MQSIIILKGFFMSITVVIQVPEMTMDQYAKLSGLTPRTIDGMIQRGHLPTVKVGKRRMVNVALRTVECLQSGGVLCTDA